MLRILTLLLAFAPLGGGAQIVWEEALVEVANFPKSPTQEEIYQLARYAGNEAGLPESIELKEKAWERLRSLPDFPECVVREMRVTQAAEAKALSLLARLPDPRVVRLLGDLLSGPEARGVPEAPANRIVCGPGSAGTPSSLLAARALGRMIANPPVDKYWEDYLSDDMEPWQRWYERVKKEKRSFRFKGMMQDYDLDGTVAVAKAGEQRPSKRERLATAALQSGVATKEERSGSKEPVITLGLVALTALGYRVISRQGRGKPAA